MDLKTGTTPIAFLSNFILAKMENKNPSGSIKDRITDATLIELRNLNKISIGSNLISILNGEFAVSFAYFCSKRGYKCNIICSEKINKNHYNLCILFGANMIDVDSDSYEDFEYERNELMKKDSTLINIDFYDKKMSKNGYHVSFCKELLLQLQASNKSIKNIFVFSESGLFAESLKENFPNSHIFNVTISNRLFNINGKKRDIVHNLNIFNENKFNKNIYANEINVKFDKVVDNIKKVSKLSGLLMDYRTSACYLAAKDYICFNNDVNLIVFYENGERYVEEVLQF